MAKVLVVDDDENNRLLLGTLLGYEGHAVIEASTGIAALQRAAEGPLDVVIVDLSLPDMSGAELIRRLRADARTASTIIALYTATQLSPAIDELVETYSVQGVIPKPGDPQQILEAFSRLVKR